MSRSRLKDETDKHLREIREMAITDRGLHCLKPMHVTAYQKCSLTHIHILVSIYLYYNSIQHFLPQPR